MSGLQCGSCDLAAVHPNTLEHDLALERVSIRRRPSAFICLGVMMFDRAHGSLSSKDSELLIIFIKVRSFDVEYSVGMGMVTDEYDIQVDT